MLVKGALICDPIIFGKNNHYSSLQLQMNDVIGNRQKPNVHCFAICEV